MRQRVMTQAAHTVSLLGLLLLVSASAALLLWPVLASQQVPELTAEHVGKPFQAPSMAGFKSSRDVEVVDEAATLRRRAEARARVRTVYDLDPQVAALLASDVESAFGAMRAVAADLAAAHQHAEAPAGRRPPSHELEITRGLLEARARFEALAAPLEADDLQVLAQARFSTEVEQGVRRLLAGVYRARVATTREELQRQEQQGITVRVLGGGPELVLSVQPPAVLDLSEAAAEVERLATSPEVLAAELPVSVKRAAARLAKRLLRPDLTVNQAESEARRARAYEAVKPVTLSVKRGQRLLNDGELVTEGHLVLLRGLKAQLTQLDMVQQQLGGAGVVAILLAGLWLAFASATPRFRPRLKDALFLAVLGVLGLAFLQLWVLASDELHERWPVVPVEAWHVLFPAAVGSMLLRFVLTAETSLYFAVAFSALTGLLLGNSLSLFLYGVVCSGVAASFVARVRSVAGLFRAGLLSGLAGSGLLVLLAFGFGKSPTLELALQAGAALVAGAVLLPLTVWVVAPLSEWLFGYASDLKLLELSNLNHPALKELVLQAPGTYHHSILMGSLVEPAAEAIGANPLLARTCAYYHDLGKCRNPQAYGENVKHDANPHDAMAPSASAALIRAHVADGQELARAYRLPRPVAAGIPEHHGTRVMAYFLHKARREAEARGEAVDEAAFRYLGPKPQSRETALVMLADAVEAAARGVQQPTREKLESLVRHLVQQIAAEGQLDDCELTFKELQAVQASFATTLDTLYHARPALPREPAPAAPVLTVVQGEKRA